MKNKYKTSFFLILFFFITVIWKESGVNVFAQNRNIDSLRILIKKDKPDTNKVNHFNKLSREYINIGSYGNALLYANSSLQLATVIQNGEKSFPITQATKKGIADSYSNFGIVYWRKSDYTKALEYYFKALKIDEELRNKNGIARHLCNIGLVNRDQGDYPMALEYSFKALKIAEELENKNGIAICLGNIGIVYWTQGDNQRALDYYFKALKIDQALENKNGILRHLGNIGGAYDNQGVAQSDPFKKEYLFIKALNYYFQALKIAEELGDKNAQAQNLGNIGKVYAEQKNYARALEFFSSTQKIQEELGDENGIARNLFNIGSLYFTTGKYKEAEYYMEKSLVIAENIGALDLLHLAEENISQLYDTTGRLKEALIHHKKAMVLKDTLFSQENKKQLVRKELNYEFDKKEQATKAEQYKKDAAAAAEKNKQNFVLVLVSCVLILVFLFAGYVFRSLRITRKQKQIIEIKNKETENQKKIIEEKNKDITDSIHYAKRIQNALLRDEEHTSMHLPEHFIMFLPKDIVSGDFYWGAEKQGYWYFAVVDCTGHGVPGAVMSMLGISFLNDIISPEQLLNPAEILNRLRNRVVKELRQTGESGGSKDGMDISLCRLDLRTNMLQWAGANNSLNLIQNGQVRIVKADKQPIGYHPNSHLFTNHEIPLQKGDSIYIYSDGYADQFGGPKGKKLKYKQLDNLIICNYQLSMKDQKELLKKHFAEWKGVLEQVDDVCVFGVKV